MKLIYLSLILPVFLFGNDCEPNRPFHATIHGDWVGWTGFSTHGTKGDKILFNYVEAELGSVFYHNPNYDESVDLTLSYIRTRMDWQGNPYFDLTEFNSVAARLAFLTRRLCNWEWKGFVKMFINADYPNFNEYLTWDFTLWGTYRLCQNLNFHVGIYGELGMKCDHLFPIIGLDWYYTDRIKVNLVFPMDLSVLYIIDDHWDIAIAQRFLRSRQRVNEDQPLPMGIWEYYNTGTELGVDYRIGKWLLINGHAGVTWGGKLRIDNKSRRKARHYDYDPAPYLGGEANVRF